MLTDSSPVVGKSLMVVDRFFFQQLCWKIHPSSIPAYLVVSGLSSRYFPVKPLCVCVRPHRDPALFPSHQLSITLCSMHIARILSRTPRSRLGSRGLATTAPTSLSLTPRSTPIGLTSARSTRNTSTLIPFYNSFSSRNLATMSGAAVDAQPEVASSQAKIIDGNAIAK
jgi:hypothetical protein